MKTIFFFITRGLTSDVLRTSYVKLLANRFRVVVFTKHLDQTTGEKEYQTPSTVFYEQWPVYNSWFLGKLKFLRIWAIHQFDYLSGVRQYYQKKQFLSDKRARLIRFLSRPFGWLLTTDFFTALEKKIIKVPSRFRDLCQKYQPIAVLVSTPGMSVMDAEAILLAKRMGLPSLAVNFNWDNLTLQKAHLLRRCDYLLVWNKIIKDQAVKIHGYSPDRVFVVGVPRFDHYFQPLPGEIGRDEFLRQKGLNPNLKTILFVTESRSYSFQIKWLNALFDLRKQKKIPYVNIFVRVHPNEDLAAYEQFLNYPDVHVEPAGQPMIGLANRIEMRQKDLLNQKLTLRYTDINFNYCSTMSLESMIFDKPVIIFQEPGYYDTEKTHYKPLIERGAVRLVKNYEELAAAINTYLQNPMLDSHNRQAVLDDYIPFRDGHSIERNIDTVCHLLNN